MEILEYVLMAVLLISAIVIVVAVLLQKSGDEGLSGALTGSSDTFYGKDKSAHTDRALFKWTVIAGIVFAVCVLAVYVIQPDYANDFALDEWMNSNLNNYSDILK